MPKILKVYPTVVQDKGMTHYTYPDEYDSKKIQVLGYGEDENGVTCCIGVVQDDDAGLFLASDAITEVTKEEATTLGEAWRPQREVIKKPNIVAPIVVKMVRGETLTGKENAIIDPDDKTLGLNKTTSFTKALERHLK